MNKSIFNIFKNVATGSKTQLTQSFISGVCSPPHVKQLKGLTYVALQAPLARLFGIIDGLIVRFSSAHFKPINGILIQHLPPAQQSPLRQERFQQLLSQHTRWGPRLPGSSTLPPRRACSGAPADTKSIFARVASSSQC